MIFILRVVTVYSIIITHNDNIYNNKITTQSGLIIHYALKENNNNAKIKHKNNDIIIVFY